MTRDYTKAEMDQYAAGYEASLTKPSEKAHWLQYKNSSVAFIKFTENGDGTVNVKGPLGAASYIAQDLPVEEARSFYRDCLKDGYHSIDSKDAPGYHAHEAFTYGR